MNGAEAAKKCFEVLQKFVDDIFQFVVYDAAPTADQQ